MAQVAEAGVARVTFGSGLFHKVEEATATMAERLAARGDPYA